MATNTQEIIRNCLIASEVSSSLKTEDIRFWNDHGVISIPEKIVVASSSLRKALGMNVWLNSKMDKETGEITTFFSENIHPDYQSSFTSNPLTWYEYLAMHVQNGNGALREGLFVGNFHGVQVWVESQDSETDEKDPRKQAILKAEGLRNKYKGQNILIIANDGLDYVHPVLTPSRILERNRSTRIPSHNKPRFILGKPINERDFIEGDEATEEDYLRNYISKHYKVDRIAVPTIAMAAIDALTDELQTAIHALSVRVTSENLKEVRANKHAAGGGVVQYLLFRQGYQGTQAEAYETLMQITGAPIEQMLHLAIGLRSRKAN